MGISLECSGCPELVGLLNRDNHHPSKVFGWWKLGLLQQRLCWAPPPPPPPGLEAKGKLSPEQ